MAVIAILTEQSDFTGEFPITDHAVGVWRLNEAAVAEDETVSFPDASAYGRDLVLVGTDYALTKGVLGNAIRLNASTGSCYLKAINDGTFFSPLYGRLVFGGSFRFPSIPEGVVPLLATQKADTLPLFRLDLNGGKVNVMLNAASGATCFSSQENLQLQPDTWYFIAVTVDTVENTVQTVIGCYTDGTWYTSPLRTFATAVNTASEADLLIGAFDYTHPRRPFRVRWGS